jgi:alanyl-tRNA synthetase
VDEVKDLDETWRWIADKVGMSPDAVKAAIDPIKDLYVLLDHTRSVLMAVEDGSLPSNVGGASNTRNILRRTFAIMTKRGWWEKLGMDGFLELFDKHKEDLSKIYGPFKPYLSFRTVMELEFQRWQTTDEKALSKINALVKKRKGLLSLEDWMEGVTTHGIPADAIARLTNTPIPGNLWYKIEEAQSRLQKQAPPVLWDTQHLSPTISTYYADHLEYSFEAKILEVFPNVTNNFIPNIVVLDRSAFYPTSGGQEHDVGTLVINKETFQVVNVLKVGPCVLHFLDRPLSSDLESHKGVAVSGTVDSDRRDKLRNNHTATHIVYAACRHVLGPHVWQNGAKKNVESAHLDITHYQSLTQDQVLAIQAQANRTVRNCRQITKGFMPKDEAERKYGFHLYQGGVVPGNELRVVDIAGIDTEACCGTHADNTAEVGTIKILKTVRLSDGIVRLYYVAGEQAVNIFNHESEILYNLSNSWGVGQQEIPATAERFFAGYKALSTRSARQEMRILELAMKVFLLQSEPQGCFYKSDQSNPTLFISSMPQFAAEIKKQGKTCVFLGKTFVYGLVGKPIKFDPTQVLGGFLENKANEPDTTDGKPTKKKGGLIIKDTITIKADLKAKKAAEKITEIIEFSSFSVPPGPNHQYNEAVCELLRKAGLVEGELD